MSETKTNIVIKPVPDDDSESISIDFSISLPKDSDRLPGVYGAVAALMCAAIPEEQWPDLLARIDEARQETSERIAAPEGRP